MTTQALRPPRGAGLTTDQLISVDIRQWRREGWLDRNVTSLEWRNGEDTVFELSIMSHRDKVTLRYGSGESTQHQTIPLAWMKCHYGGERPWFLCGCGKQWAILYLQGKFACRQCHGLTYPSQREIPGKRATRSAEKIRKRLGWQPGPLSGRGEKPKWMHHSTYKALVERHDESVALTLREVSQSLGWDREQTEGQEG